MMEVLKLIWDMILETVVEFVIVAVVAVALTVVWLIVSSRHMKTGIKTFTFLAASELIACFIGWLSWQCYRMNNLGGAVVIAIVAAGLAVGFLAAGIYGHKKKWLNS